MSTEDKFRKTECVLALPMTRSRMGSDRAGQRFLSAVVGVDELERSVTHNGKDAKRRWFTRLDG